MGLSGTTVKVSFPVSDQLLKSRYSKGHHAPRSRADQGAMDTDSLDWPPGRVYPALPHLLPGLISPLIFTEPLHVLEPGPKLLLGGEAVIICSHLKQQDLPHYLVFLGPEEKRKGYRQGLMGDVIRLCWV